MRPPTLILYNADVITLERVREPARLVACIEDRIVYVGDDSDLPRLQGPATKIIDCQGLTLIPGFQDAHLHFFALASSLMAVDCSRRAVYSISDMKLALQRRAASIPINGWVRGHGYDEAFLVEGRHPTREDLDAAVPDRFVRLDDRTGHACVLNSRALEFVGITALTPDPVDGVIQRDEAGRPTGVLFEMNNLVSSRIARQTNESSEGTEEANRILISNGVTSFQDASPANDVDRFEILRSMKQEGRLASQVTVMPGIRHLEGFLARGFDYGSGGDGIRRGHAKVMVTATTGIHIPAKEELLDLVMEAQRRGFPVAIHAVEAEAVDLAADVITEARRVGGSAFRHRIEHVSECPPKSLEKLRASGAVVVTQPGFIFRNGEKYRHEVSPVKQPFLYAIADWMRAGVAVAFSSDAPVVPPIPMEAIYAAITRRTDQANTVAPAQSIDPQMALRLFTLGGAYANNNEHIEGSILPGKRADLVLLDANPTTVDPEILWNIRVLLTTVGGQIVWEG